MWGDSICTDSINMYSSHWYMYLVTQASTARSREKMNYIVVFECDQDVYN